MLVLHIFTSYRLAGIRVNKKEALKYTSTEQQSCLLAGHSIPIASVRVVFSWIEAVVYFLPGMQHYVVRTSWNGGLALPMAKMCMSLSP